jgi:hypothetical protein
MGAQRIPIKQAPAQSKRDEFERRALAQAHQIVQHEGAAFAVATRDRGLATIQEKGTVLALAIAKAIVEAFDSGQKGS